MSDIPEEEDVLPVESGAPNVAEPAKVRQRTRDTRRKARREEDVRREWWQQAFSTPEGRRELWGILASGHAFDERFVAGPNGFPCTEATWCEAGEQRLAFRVYLSWLRLDPDGVALMLAENDPRLAQS